MNLSLFADLAVNGLVIGGIYAVVAIGLNMQYGLMRILNIAHGEFLMIGAFLTFTLHTVTGISPLVFIPVVMLASFVLGVILHRLVFRRLTAQAKSLDQVEERSLIIGFGLMFILQNVATLIWGSDLHGYDFLSEPVKFGGVIVTQNRLLVLFLALLISIFLILLLQRTLIGKAVRGMLQSPIGAQLVGVDAARLNPFVFGLGIAMAGLAGALLSMIYEVTPSIGESYTIMALIVITLGGLGSIGGSFMAALLLGMIESFGTHLTNPSLKMILSYSVFVLILMFKPKGLFAK
ncbi:MULTISPECIES: branched-chain amino acid ABC transporter permease [unclassified Pusillimonas]|jgi:branched-chain amino acid transport system permease protein|uniref:branched-chain amino acid ABC transporter permease n=1 Tax=unclassified Pusillimonas TaxID=2640016 RepID=UPI000B9CAFE7|nr:MULTISPECIES: branched-chain amino acid ABC transporter permease [unclassified Pusillimonas]OXR49128.1 branched-chain amino acid ABC transporter permease [Pusillimonas sp. T2]ROT46007.1 branched-chain amino acid ABC transporter permease [Pusillimonas sp. NJUB218]